MFQVSNDIIRLCSRSISLERIFRGFVLSSKKDLSDCIQCCQIWKQSYEDAKTLHQK